MTNREAIEWFKKRRNGSPMAGARKMFDLAIAALEQQEKTFGEWCHDCKEYDKDRHCCPRFSKVIRGALDEVEQQRWIPVTERLPERGVDVLVTQLPNDWNGKRYKVSPAWRCNVEDVNPHGEWALTGRLDFRSVIPIDKVLAWRPLPEPYQEDEA